MRKALVATLCDLAEKDPRVLFLTADLGYTVVEPFADRFPDRFFNVGVSEQNMIGMATGLAEGGFIPYAYSIATFSVLRPYEFIRNGPALQHLPVRIIGVGGGFDYAPAGPTHYALEDVGALRMLPGLSVIAPADFRQCRSALLASHGLPGPAYFRLGKDETNEIPGLDGGYEAGRLQVVREGGDMLLLALGPSAFNALKAADALAARGIACTVAVVSCMSPVPEADLRGLLSRFPCAVTAEAHYAVGGLGSLACEVAAGNGIPCKVIRCGVTRSPAGIQGNQDYMQKLHGIATEDLVEAAVKGLAEARSRTVPQARSPDWGAVPGAPVQAPTAPAPAKGIL
jgi:transketolase